MRGRVAVACLAIVMLVGFPAVSSAFFGTVADGRTVQRFIGGGGVECFFFFGVAGRSYSVEARALQAFAIASMFIGGPGVVCPAADGAGLTNADTDPPLGGAPFGRRASFVAPATTFYMTTVTNGGGAQLFEFTVSDTTLFSPAWSTSGTFETFFSFLNTTNAACSGTLTLLNTAGVVIDIAISGAIAAGGTFSTNTAAMATPNNLTGIARFTHNCPPGGILAEAAIANFSIAPTPYIQIVKFQPVRDAGR